MHLRTSYTPRRFDIAFYVHGDSLQVMFPKWVFIARFATDSVLVSDSPDPKRFQQFFGSV